MFEDSEAPAHSLQVLDFTIDVLYRRGRKTGIIQAAGVEPGIHDERIDGGVMVSVQKVSEADEDRIAAVKLERDEPVKLPDCVFRVAGAAVIEVDIHLLKVTQFFHMGVVVKEPPLIGIHKAEEVAVILLATNNTNVFLVFEKYPAVILEKVDFVRHLKFDFTVQVHGKLFLTQPVVLFEPFKSARVDLSSSLMSHWMTWEESTAGVAMRK